jgi:hypothetical protein
MATYKITINMDSAAFQDGNEGIELSAILRYLASENARAGQAADTHLLDRNGNTVGMAEVVE